MKPPRRAPPRKGASSVLRATLEYEGTRYRGWQVQVNARTVQGTLLLALRELCGEGTTIAGAGRTDAGVHALAQVASIQLPAGFAAPNPERLRAALNDGLPADIHVLSLTGAPARFHARHDALLRIYRYRFSRRRTAFGKPFVWWVKEPLDVPAMARAARRLEGRHDFSSFCDRPEEHDSTLVEVSFARVEIDARVRDLVLFRIGASHFLWKMVRRLAGALVEVGTGRLSGEELASFLSARTARPAAWTAPPSGLFLETVLYPGDPAPEEIHPLRPGF